MLKQKLFDAWQTEAYLYIRECFSNGIDPDLEGFLPLSTESDEILRKYEDELYKTYGNAYDSIYYHEVKKMVHEFIETYFHDEVMANLRTEWEADREREMNPKRYYS
jgi:hypothetical protein